MQRRFPIEDILLRSADIHDQVVSCRNFVFEPQNFGGKGAPKFLSKFFKSGSLSNMWQSLVTIGQVTSNIRQPKKDLKSKLQQQNIMVGGHNLQRVGFTVVLHICTF